MNMFTFGDYLETIMKVTPFARQLKNRKRIWMRIYIEKGVRSEQPTNLYLTGDKIKDKKNWKTAKDEATLIEASIIEGDLKSLRSKGKKIKVKKYLSIYLNNYTKKDRRMIKYSIEKFEAFIGHKQLNMNDLNNKHIKDFFDYLKSDEAGLSGETPNNYFTRFKKIIRAAIDDNFVDKNILDNIKMKSPRDSVKKEILTIDEIKLLNQVYWGNEEVKNAFLFACFTGLGYAELKKISWNRVNLKEKTLIVFREKTKEQIVNTLHTSAIKILELQKAKDYNTIFKLKSDNAVNKVLKNAVKKAKIEKSISFYCGRHSFAVNLLKNGANLKTVADCLGHTTTKHTLKYLNYVDELKEKAVNAIPEI